MTQRNLVRALAVVGTLLAPVALAQPTQMTFTGNLTNSGAPTTGNHNFVFTLFDQPSGGTNAWTESQANLPVNNGVITTVLGATTALTPAILNGAPLYLEVTVDGTVLAPRIAVVSTPYAVRAAVANTASTLGPLAPNDVQRRVVGTCSAGNAMMTIDAAGAVTCVAVGTGDITDVIAGSGLSGGALTGSATLAVDGTVQRRGAAPNNLSCPAGQYVNSINASGGAVCATDLDTGVNGVTPGTGISASIAGRNLTINNTGVTSIVNGSAAITVSPSTGAVTVTPNIGTTAATLAAGNHGHNFSCGQRRQAAAAGSSTVGVTCATGEVLTGGGCNSDGTIIDSFPYAYCPPLIFCLLCTQPRCFADSWSCTKTGGSNLTAYAVCCTDPIRGNVP